MEHMYMRVTNDSKSKKVPLICVGLTTIGLCRSELYCGAEMTRSKEEILADPKLLNRVLDEWRVLRDAIRESPVLFAIYDKHDNLVAWNKSYEDNHPEAFEKHAEEAREGKLPYRTLLRYQVEKTNPGADTDAEVERLVAWQRSADGKPYERFHDPAGWMRIYKYSVSGGAAAGIAMNIDDIKENERALKALKAEAERAAAQLQIANEEIENQALHDELTGLPNRRKMERYLMEKKNSQLGQQECAILHIDLDRFKQVNDTIGHAAGDHVLVEVAKALQSACNEDDLAVRIGGDEFVLIKMTVSRDECTALAADIIATISEPFEFKGNKCRVGASIGIMRTSLAEAKVEDILPCADVALYRAKERGRGRFEMFDAALKDDMARNTKLADELMEALEQKDFVPFYQPQFFAKDLSIAGVEALCRWKRLDGTILGPDDFLKVAGNLSLVGDIDRVMCSRVAEDFDRLDGLGILPPKVSLNVGYQRLLDHDLVADVSALKRPGLAVVIELLETLSLDAPEQEVNFAVDALKEAGIAVEIDDFGSCRASIVSLISVAPSAMKIDQQIVRPGPNSESFRQLIRAIVEIGKALGISVTAEGVETERHVNMARSLGCDVLQGYALAKPMPICALEGFLSSGFGVEHFIAAEANGT